LFIVKSKRPLRFFWGWIIVGVSMLTLGLSSSTAFYANAIFLLPLQSHFHTERTVIAQAFALTQLLAAGALPFVGMALDRWGPRRALIFGLSGLTLTHFLLARVDALWQFYVLIILQQSLFTRFNDVMTQQSLLGRWFVRLRGRAMGLTMAGVGAAGLVLPAIIGLVIQNHGWRSGYLLAGILVGGLTLPAVIFLLLDNPQQVGQHPDGAAQAPAVFYTAASGATFAQAVRSPALWLLGFCAVLCFIDHGMMSLQMPALVQDAGLSASAAASLFGLMLGVSVIGRLAIGSLTDRLNRFHLLGFSLLGMACGSLCLQWPASSAARLLYVFIYGVASGGAFTALPVTGQAIFGLRNFGKIYAIVTLLSTLGTAAGNYLGARAYDWLGSYRMAVWMAAAASALAGMLAFTLRAPAWGEGETPATSA